MSEESFVVEGNINNHDVIVVDDVCGFNLKFVNPEESEFFNLDGVFMNDSGLGCDIDVEIVGFDLFNSDLGLKDDLILELNKDSSLFGFSLSNDLKSISFNLDEGISSEDLNLNIDVGIDFDSEGNDHLIGFSSHNTDGVLDVDVDFFSDDGDFNFGPVPEVGCFGIDVNENGLVDEFDLDSSILFELLDSEGNLEVYCINLLLNRNLHFRFEYKDNSVSFGFNFKSCIVDHEGPFSLNFNDELSVSESECFNFGKIVSIDFSDSKPVFLFSPDFVFS